MFSGVGQYWYPELDVMFWDKYDLPGIKGLIIEKIATKRASIY